MLSGSHVPADWWDDFPPVAGSRKPAVKGRITGKVVEWKNKFGWITPDTPLNHPEARLKGGRIYLSQEDVAEVIDGVGAAVSFYVYADGSGLGAMACVPVNSPTAKAPLPKRPKLGMPSAKGRAKPAAPAGGVGPLSSSTTTSSSGRKSLGDKQLKGVIKSWRGAFGFITPSSPIDHPLYTGSVFVAKGDIENPEALDVGKAVTFYLSVDAQGLGAEKCQIQSAGEGGASPASPVADSNAKALDILGGSLLRSKAKAAPGSPPAAPPGSALARGFTAPTAKAHTPKGGILRATAKASASAPQGDPDLERKMNENPELKKRLHAWMFDAGG